MTKNKKIDSKKFKKVLPYFAAGIFTIALVATGSIDKAGSNTSLSLDAFAKEDYKVSVDQLSGLYVVANVSDSLGLASAGDAASNYVIATSMRDAGQVSTDKIEKPAYTHIASERGVIKHDVKSGESMESIASKYGVTTDQIRWSNNKKTTDISEGETLYIPASPGIVYEVKSDDTIESIVSKYGSSVTEIIARNDLEDSGIQEGMRILISGGELPETERPEYVAPVITRPTYYYTYLGNTSERQNIEVVGYFSIGHGQCVDWALHMRPDLQPHALALGNANTWAGGAMALGYAVDHTPSAGAVFQTASGWYGHVGYVESVNGDGSIVVTEMNYSYVPYRVIRATIPASAVGNFFYIH